MQQIQIIEMNTKICVLNIADKLFIIFLINKVKIYKKYRVTPIKANCMRKSQVNMIIKGEGQNLLVYSNDIKTTLNIISTS